MRHVSIFPCVPAAMYFLMRLGNNLKVCALNTLMVKLDTPRYKDNVSMQPIRLFIQYVYIHKLVS